MNDTGFALPPAPKTSSAEDGGEPQPTFPPSIPSSPAPPPSPSFFRRRGLALTIIIVLVILLMGVAFEAGLLGIEAGTGQTINSVSTPLTGQELYAAYTTNQSQADASYNNKIVYIQDSLDFGVGIGSAGEYFSTVNSGSVILVWSDQAQVGQLYPGETVLARCSVDGLQSSPLGSGLVLYLKNCALISAQSQASSTQSLSVANL